MGINLEMYLRSFDDLGESFDLDRLCGCQLNAFADEIEKLTDQKEELLGLLYLETLVQGFVYSFDPSNFWNYLRLLGNRSINMCYHGGEVQFRLLLKIPQYKSSYNQARLFHVVNQEGIKLLPLWSNRYVEVFGSDALDRIKRGVQTDSDVYRLIEEFPCLEFPIKTTFNIKDT